MSNPQSNDRPDIKSCGYATVDIKFIVGYYSSMDLTKTTKYFGTVTLDSYYGFKATLDGKEISFGIDSNEVSDNELSFFWEIVDKYMEIHETGKKAIVKYYQGINDPTINFDGIAKSFFSKLFRFKTKEELIALFGVDDFKDFNIKDFIDKIPYPNLDIEFKDEIEICLFYIVSNTEEWRHYSLYVVMDKDLTIINIGAILD